MKLELENAVVLAESYAKLRDWYVWALDLELGQEWTEDYHYAELTRDGKKIVGIADTKEMKVTPVHPRSNSVALQVRTDDIEELFDRVRASGGEVSGPFRDAKEDFRFGSFSDPEGNQVWVVETL